MKRHRHIPLPVMRYRRAKPADIPAMTQIRLDVTENILSDPAKITRQMYAEYLQMLGRGWVGCIGKKIVGFAYASRTDASIWALFVKPGYEGRGIGQQLIALAVDWLFGLGHPLVTLQTGAATRADRFYSRAGWIRGAEDGRNNVIFTRTAPVQCRAVERHDGRRVHDME